MKNLFLMLAFMFVGTFGFGNNNETNITEDTIVEYKRVMDPEGFATCYVRHCTITEHPDGNGGTYEAKIGGDWKRVECPTREAPQLA